MNNYSWERFITLADQFIIEYSLPVPVKLSISIKLFLVGHAVELYLKAAYTKITGDVKTAINYKHNIKGLFDACKSGDPYFMPGYEIRPQIFNMLKNPDSIFEKLSKNERAYYLEHQELYTISYMLSYLKYFGAPDKRFDNSGMVITYSYPNSYWITFFRQLRKYLGVPTKDRIDLIAENINSGELPVSSSNYLSDLYKEI